MAHQVTAKKLLTAVVFGLGIWYIMPTLHSKWNIESYFGRSFSTTAVKQIGIALLIGAVILNAQVGFELVRVKQLDFLSPQRRKEKTSIANFCNLVSNMERVSQASEPVGLDAGPDF